MKNKILRILALALLGCDGRLSQAKPNVLLIMRAAGRR